MTTVTRVLMSQNHQEKRKSERDKKAGHACCGSERVTRRLYSSNLSEHRKLNTIVDSDLNYKSSAEK